jgi:hypothetical protein
MPFTTPVIISPINEIRRVTIWKVIEPLNFYSMRYKKNYVVPAGSITDLKSSLVKNASAAAIVHDHLYGRGFHYKQIKDRKEADQVFLEAMLDSGVTKTRALFYYWAVRVCGHRYLEEEEEIWPNEPG